MNPVVGKYLIARPAIEYGIFAKSVIFVYENSLGTTAGVSLTKPTDIRFSTICSQFGHTAQTGDSPIYIGGPVNKQSLIMLHSDDFSSTNTLITGTGLNISSDALMVEKLSCTAWPRYYRLVTGICVWSSQQIKAEIQKSFWLISDLPSEVVFSYDGEELWSKAVDHVSKTVFDPYI